VHDWFSVQYMAMYNVEVPSKIMQAPEKSFHCQLHTKKKTMPPQAYTQGMTSGDSSAKIMNSQNPLHCVFTCSLLVFSNMTATHTNRAIYNTMAKKKPQQITSSQTILQSCQKVGNLLLITMGAGSDKRGSWSDFTGIILVLSCLFKKKNSA